MTGRVVSVTAWTCWPLRGGCGLPVIAFDGGPCPSCGAYAMTRVVLRERSKA